MSIQTVKLSFEYKPGLELWVVKVETDDAEGEGLIGTALDLMESPFEVKLTPKKVT